MRWIGWVLLAVLVAGYVAAKVPPAAVPQTVPADDLWRRTCDGWERASWLASAEAIPSRRPSLHPAVVGLLEILLSAAALIVFSDSRAGGGRKQPIRSD